MKNKMEIFNFKNGKLEQIKPAPTLPLGCKVRIFAGHCDECDGAIISEPDKNGRVKIVKLCDHSLGFTNPDARHMQPLSQKFGIGTYYYDNLEIVSVEKISEFVAKGEAADEKKAADAFAKKLSDKAEIAALPALYPKLTPVLQYDIKTTKKNLITELKENFPSMKFSVRITSSCNISWTNGPTKEEVKKVVSKYTNEKSSYCGDYRDSNESNFNKVFGGFAYVFTDRNMNEEIKALIGEMKSLLVEGNNYRDCPSTFLYQIFARTNLEKNVKILGVKKRENTCGFDTSLFFDFILEEQEKKKEDKKETGEQQKIFAGIVEIVTYGEKAIAVFGDTKPMKDKLKALGGRFNPFLTNNGEKMAGWVFPKDKSRELYQLLNAAA
tara:strand:- start:50928 stop:52073 length:1146 start_codon:yes stop_codon:yes gene_type:complete